MQDKTNRELSQELKQLRLLFDKEVSEHNKLKERLRSVELMLDQKEMASEEKLVESEERFRATFYSIGDGVIATDSDGKITDMNPVAEDMCGWKMEEVSGKPLTKAFRIVNATTRKSVVNPVQKVIRSGRIEGLANHTVLISKDGREYQIADSAAPIKNKEGETSGVVLVFSDVTEKYKSEQILKRTKEQYRIISETTSDFAFSYIKGKKDYRIDWLGGAVEKITGYSAKEIKARKCLRFMVHPEDAKIFEKHVLALCPEEDSMCELRIIAHGGESRWLAVNTVCIDDAQNGVQKIYGGCKDITGRKTTEEALVESKRQLETFLQISQTIATSFEQEKVMQMIVDNATDVMGLDSGAIYLLKDKENISLEATTPPLPSGFPEKFRIAFLKDHPHIKRAIISGKLIKMHDALTSELSPAEKEIVRLKGLRSNLYMPIVLRGQAIGILILSSVNRKYLFSEESISLLQGFAGQVAHIIDNTRSFEALKEYAAELVRNRTELAKSEKKLKNITSSIQDIVFTLDREQRHTDVFGSWVQKQGLTPEHFLGRKASEIMGKELAKVHEDASARALKGKYVVYDWSVDSQKGTLYYQTSLSPLYSENGDVEGVVGVGRDVTEQMLMAESLRKSEEKHRRLFETMSQGVIYQAAGGNIISANPASEKILGLSLDQMQGKTSMDPRWKMITEDGKEVPGSEHPSMIALSKGKKVGPAIRGIYIPEKDEYAWLSITATPLYRTGEDKPFQVYAVFDDITLDKKHEDEIKKQQQLINAILKKLPIGIAVNTVGPEPEIELINDNFARIYGVSKEDLSTPGSFWEAVYEDKKFREEIKNRVLADMESGDPERMKWHDIPITKNGKVAKYISAQNIPLEDSGVVISTVLDITERKRSELALKESETKFRTLFETANDAIFLMDKDVIFDCNKKAEEIYGCKKDQITGKTPNDFSPEYQSDGIASAVKANEKIRAALIGEKQFFEWQHKRCDGTLFDAEISLSCYRINKKPYTQSIVRDVTERKRAEAELIKAKEKAQESDRLKSAFLANMSHEIRTPMNGIMGFAELLKDPLLPAERQQQYVGIIEKSGVRMLNIINDILDISRIEAGLMDVELSVSNINEQLEYVYSFFKPQVEAKGINLLLSEKLPAKQAVITTDREKLFAILTNLVKNALKYTNEGSIDFGCVKKGSFLEFFVSDTGIGIPKDRQQAVFDRFVQADIEDKDAYQGAGLGLSISRAYVEMLGGSIRVESEVGRGSAFYFTIPCNSEDKSKEAAQTYKSTGPEYIQNKKLKILIVEDDDMSTLLISKYMQPLSREIIYAGNGSEAVETCMQHPDIDLILMDIKMPGMSGDEATRQIRRFNKDVVIIAQTARALTGEKVKAMQAGFNDYITKPINKSDLLKCIENSIREKGC